MIKIYADGADRGSILEMLGDDLIQGFTTNPSLMKKAGIKDYRAFGKEILSHVKMKPISFEVFADDLAEMKRQGLELASWAANVYVKIPITNSEGKSCLGLIRELSHQGVKLNVTALLTLEQVQGTTEAVSGGADSVVSVFAGRIADTGRDPMPMMKKSAELCAKAGKNVELLWASTREALNIKQAEECGCRIITVPADIIKKMKSTFGKDLTELSLETVKMFKADATASGFTL